MDALTRDGKFLHEKVQFTDASEKERESFSLRPGDLLFNTRNSKELVGKVCVYTGSDGWLFNNNLMRIRFKEGIEATVVATQFQFQRVQRELEQRKSGTTSVFAVYWKSLKTLPILIPPLDLQHRFATIVESIESHKTHLRAHLTELDTLFDSLQSRAFNGEL
jgi:type I restriction enzyme S subunit